MWSTSDPKCAVSTDAIQCVGRGATAKPAAKRAAAQSPRQYGQTISSPTARRGPSREQPPTPRPAGVALEAGERGADGAGHAILRQQPRGLVGRDGHQSEVAGADPLGQLAV